MAMGDAVIDATSTAGKMSNDTMSSLQEQEDTIKNGSTATVVRID